MKINPSSVLCGYVISATKTCFFPSFMAVSWWSTLWVRSKKVSNGNCYAKSVFPTQFHNLKETRNLLIRFLISNCFQIRLHGVTNVFFGFKRNTSNYNIWHKVSLKISLTLICSFPDRYWHPIYCLIRLKIDEHIWETLLRLDVETSVKSIEFTIGNC